MRSHLPPHDRVWLYADQSGGPSACWPWTAKITRKGYGQLKVNRKQQSAHRIAYEAAVGPIPYGFDVDHTCHNVDSTCSGGNACPHRRCINPRHLESVTKFENARRGKVGQLAAARQAHCLRGHPYDSENTYRAAYRTGRKWCRACNRDAVARGRTKRKAEAL